MHFLQQGYESLHCRGLHANFCYYLLLHMNWTAAGWAAHIHSSAGLRGLHCGVLCCVSGGAGVAGADGVGGGHPQER
jgi:hypothetical protein